MSDPHNNGVIQNRLSVTDRQSAANPINIFNSAPNIGTTCINHTPLIVNPNIVIPPMLPSISAMPPPPPPAAFQLQPKLNPSAPSFTPSVNQLQQQLFQRQLQDSMARLQLYSIQLNALQVATQQKPSTEALKQYQAVYQRYNLEFTNTLLLNQCIHNLERVNVTCVNELEQNSNKSNTRLETIQEGEDEAATADDDEIAPIAGIATAIGHVPKHELHEQDDEGVNKAIGEQLTEETQSIANFEKFQHETRNYGLNGNGTTTDADTDTQHKTRPVFGETEEQKASEGEKIKKQIRGILNKMTAENFDKLSQEMESILKVAEMAFIEFSKKGAKHNAILSMEEIVMAQKAQFKALIKLILKCILERAMIDVIYTNQYARLCHSLYLCAERSNEFNELKQRLLRQQLLSLCHSIFTKARHAQNKVRFIGIITMIGELYRYGLISWNVILSGIFNELLPPQTPLDIEAVCKLLKTAGNDFDRHHYDDINVIIDQLSTYGQQYDFRTRCFVKEIQEIRGNEWKPETDAHTRKPQQHMNNHRDRWRHNNNNNNKWRARHNHNNYNRSRYNARGKRMKTRPTVEFIRDVTLPDRSHYAPHKILTKTWAMRNSGDLAWGDAVELVYFKGDSHLSLHDRYPVINAQPGQQVEISATIKTPTQAGRYCTYFRLQKNGKFFGPRVWVDIIVTDITQKVAVAPYTARSETKLTSSESTHNMILQCP